MPVFAILLLVFLAVPIIEIYLLIEVGGVLGAPVTIGLVVLTAVVGAALIRAEGLATLARVQQQAAAGEIPASGIIEGALLLLSGALLLTPGFMTDAIGFLLVFRPSRMAIARAIAARAVTRVHMGAGMGPGMGPGMGNPHRRRPPGDGVIDGEFTHEDAEADRSRDIDHKP